MVIEKVMSISTIMIVEESIVQNFIKNNFTSRFFFNYLLYTFIFYIIRLFKTIRIIYYDQESN